MVVELLPTEQPLHSLAGFGIELEYMIVDQDTLDVRPISDNVLFQFAGCMSNFVDRKPIAWSNELVMHVLEFKTNGPVKSLSDLDLSFHDEIKTVNDALTAHNACLLPTAMHPWMDPDREMYLWHYDDRTIYDTYDRIFDCRGHGWSNLQSMHINLPFYDDQEFAPLHAAIRLLMPLLPALAASSPYADGKLQPQLDYRLHVYRHNADAVPTITGAVIPEPVYSRADYTQTILQRIYNDLAEVDPAGTLQEEWVNSRGAIARFDRNTIEIRIIDIQECPQADLAIAAFCAAVIYYLLQGDQSILDARRAFSTSRLVKLYERGVNSAQEAHIDDKEYLKLLGCSHVGRAAEVLNELVEHEQVRAYLSTRHQKTLAYILRSGSLASRIVRHCGSQPSRAQLLETWQALRDCLANNALFE